ncbi:MAG TPA: VIT domain-containing protein, partial [Myxococcales bacterium]|nr:VIT domain-containing protein [Myxococcales bacterium]
MTTTTAQRIPLFEQPSKKQSRMLGVLEALGPARISLPLAGVELRARVAGRVAEVRVAQKFQNTLSEPLEAIYIFPLSGGCAVSKFEMQIGARVLHGKVEERGEARRQYAVALEEGKRAALLEQERDNVFTVQVGNLMPGEEVTVRLTYSERLSFFEDGRTELRLPLVVAPRYVGGTPLEREQAGLGVAEDSSTVPDASRITPPRLAEGFDPKTSLSIECELDGGFSDLACSQHATSISVGGKGALIKLSREDEPLNRDFVLRWKIAGSQVKTSLIAHDGYALLSLLPPAREGFLGTARDVVFVVDRSGSMEGVKMASAARACALLLRTLAPRDRFAIQAFDNSAEWMPGA